MAHNGWTPERRAKQSAAIRGWKPWQHSTGPRTQNGKATASHNGWKGGVRPMLRELTRSLRKQREALANKFVRPDA